MQSSAKSNVHQQIRTVRKRTHTDPQFDTAVASIEKALNYREHCTSRAQLHVKKLAEAASSDGNCTWESHDSKQKSLNAPRSSNNRLVDSDDVRLSCVSVMQIA